IALPPAGVSAFASYGASGATSRQIEALTFAQGYDPTASASAIAEAAARQAGVLVKQRNRFGRIMSMGDPPDAISLRTGSKLMTLCSGIVST
ncbi:MAG: hypothetical protein GY847_37055, partial [Proteobacteria bacterium]|nr:hypothetical protein [Pseudomonadota bacterium]